MTWQMSCGEGVLRPANARLWCWALANMLDDWDDWDDEDDEEGEEGEEGEESEEFDFPNLVKGPFEHLPNAEKMAVFEKVAAALTQPTGEAPELSAINEGAVYYVFAYLQKEFSDNVKGGEKAWGQMILDAYYEYDTGKDKSEDAPTMGCLDTQKWIDALDDIAFRILWDRDWEEKVMSSDLDDYYQSFQEEVYDVRGAKARLLEVLDRAGRVPVEQPPAVRVPPPAKTHKKDKGKKHKKQKRKDEEQKGKKHKKQKRKDEEQKGKKHKDAKPKDKEHKGMKPKDKEPKDKEPKDKEPKDKEPKDKERKDKEPKDTKPKDKEPKEKEPKDTKPKDKERKDKEQDAKPKDKKHKREAGADSEPPVKKKRQHTER